MPAPTPPNAAHTLVAERIRQDIKSTLESVTVANGWHKTLTVRDRQQRGEPSQADGLCIIYVGDEEIVEGQDQTSTEREIVFGIRFHVVQSEAVSTAIDIEVNKVRGDIEYALCQPSTMQRSGLALITEPAGFLQLEEGDGEAAGGIVLVRVQFATDFTNGFVSHYGVA